MLVASLFPWFALSGKLGFRRLFRRVLAALSKRSEFSGRAPKQAGSAHRIVHDSAMADTLYCYHCRTYHPREEMRQIDTKGGKRWRCIKSIEATKRSAEEREAFGRQMTAMNKAEAQSKARILNGQT